MHRSHRSGLTPTETLIIAAIVAAFALMLARRFVGDPQHEAHVRTVERVRTVMQALERYAIDNAGNFPTTDQGLDALVSRPTGEDAPIRWQGPYVEDEQMLVDGWDKPLHYVSPVDGDQPYHLWSSGADFTQGGDGANADIESWDRSTLVP